MSTTKTASQWLLDAAQFGDSEGFKSALAAGADVNARDGEGWTAAMMACSFGREADLRVLIAAGADLEAKSNDGWTAANLAAAKGRGGVSELIEAVRLGRKEAAELEAASGSPDSIDQPRPGRRALRV